MILVLSFGLGQAEQILISASACQRLFLMLLELLLFKMSLALFACVYIGRLRIYIFLKMASGYFVIESITDDNVSAFNCHAVPEFVLFLIWLRRPLYPSNVGLSLSKLPYLTLPLIISEFNVSRCW